MFSALRRYFRKDPGPPIHFLHIGKTGGTAVKHAVAEGRLARVVVHPHGTKLADVPAGEKVFFFLRDPITRYASGFISRQRQGRPRYSVPWDEAEAAAFGRFESPNALAEALSSEDVATQAAAQAAMKGIGHVRDSYWDWLKSPAYLRSRSADILFIGQQEHLREDVLALSKLLQCEPLELPEDHVAAHRNPETADRSLSESAMENLRRWYRDDFAALEVCAEIARERGFGGSLGAAPQH